MSKVVCSKVLGSNSRDLCHGRNGAHEDELVVFFFFGSLSLFPLSAERYGEKICHHLLVSLLPSLPLFTFLTINFNLWPT